MTNIISYENLEIKNKLRENKEKNQAFILENIFGRKDAFIHVNSYGKIGEKGSPDGFRSCYLGIKEQDGKIIPAVINDGLCKYQGDIRNSEENYGLFNSRVKIEDIEDDWKCINFDIVIPTQFYENEKLSKQIFTTDDRGNSNTNITILFPKNKDSQETLKTLKENPEIFLEFYRFVLPRQFKSYEEIRNYRNSKGYFDMLKNKFNEESVKKSLESNSDFFTKGIERYLEERQDIQKRIDKTKRKEDLLKFFGMKSFKKYAELDGLENRLSKAFEGNEETIKHFENLKKESEKNLETLKNFPEEFLGEYQDKIIKRDYPEFMIKEYFGGEK